MWRGNGATLTATLQNSMVRLTTTPYFKGYFENGASLTSTTQGTKLTVDPHTAASEEQLLFVTPGTKLSLEGYGVKQDPGNGSAPKVCLIKP